MRTAAFLAAASSVLIAQESPQTPAPRTAAQPPATQQEAAATKPDPYYGLELVHRLAWRGIGPANMGGRITDLDVPAEQPNTWYVATAGGGLWKTTNAGTTWTALFQNQPTVSIGDVAVAPSNSDIVWVGTGEENARNSVQWGDGVYKSTDAGKTWKHMGLPESFQIGHIAIHPQNPDVVYVAALGRLWSHNRERGVFRTRDGGESWEHVLYLDDATGCIDVRIDPREPNTVYAAMYERMRDIYCSNDPAVRFGAKAGLWRSDDGGSTWKPLTNGLPTCKWGRSGLALHGTKAGVIYAVIETERSGWARGDQERVEEARPAGNAYAGLNAEDAEGGGARLTQVTDNGPSATAGLQVGDVVTRIGDAEIKTAEDLTDEIRAANGGDKAKIAFRRGEQPQELEITWGTRPQRGGGQPQNRFQGRLGGQRENLQDQQGELGFETGGIFRSDDRGESWTRLNSLTERPFYYSILAVDPQDDQAIYHAAVAFWQSLDGGKEFKAAQRGVHVDFHAVWIDPNDSDRILLGGDGGIAITHDRCKTWEVINNFSIGQYYHASADNALPYNVYGGLQDNGTWRVPSRTRWSEGITRDDCIQFYGGDGFTAHPDPEDPDVVFATSQNGAVGGMNLATGARFPVQRPQGQDRASNWDAPFFLSPHNPRVLYFAGRYANRAWNRGRNVEALSPALGATEKGTATAFAESPLQVGLLYVGTDEGTLWRSKDAGKTWEAIHDKLTGMPGRRYVSCIHPSYHEAERVYVSFDGHRNDDFATHVWVSDDAGDTWTWLRGDLPDQPAHVCRDLPPHPLHGANPDLLVLGTEFGCYVSFDRGKEWMQLGQGLPTVAVRDLALQARDSELIAATHGQGLFVLDVSALRQIDGEVTAKPAHLFRPELLIQWQLRQRGLSGHKDWRAPNPPPGVAIHLWLAQKPADAPVVTVHDVTGAQVATVTGLRAAGIQRLQWNGRITGEDEERPQARRGRRGGGGRQAPPGSYSLRFGSGSETLVQPLTVAADPIAAAPSPAVSVPANTQDQDR